MYCRSCFPSWICTCTDPARHLLTAGEDLNHVDHDLSDLAGEDLDELDHDLSDLAGDDVDGLGHGPI